MYTRDGLKQLRSVRDGSGLSNKTRIATFSGSAFVAEREGNDLCIYVVSDDPFPTDTNTKVPGAINDKGPMTTARLQAINERSRHRL